MATRFSNISGSNNITMPLLQRVRQRLIELERIGKDHFQKGEDGEWNDIPASMPIDGVLHIDKCVKRISEDEYQVIYKTYLTKVVNGVPIVVRKTIKAGPGDIGMEVHQLDEKITEVFKKGKLFTTIKEKVDAQIMPSAYKDQEWKDEQESLKRGGLPPEKIVEK